MNQSNSVDVDYAVLALRVLLGALFINAGSYKIVQLVQGAGQVQQFIDLGIPFAEIAAWAVGIAEVLFGLLLLLGLFIYASTTVLGLIITVALFLTQLNHGVSIGGIIDHLIYLAGLILIQIKETTHSIEHALS